MNDFLDMLFFIFFVIIYYFFRSYGFLEFFFEYEWSFYLHFIVFLSSILIFIRSCIGLFMFKGKSFSFKFLLPCIAEDYLYIIFGFLGYWYLVSTGDKYFDQGLKELFILGGIYFNCSIFLRFLRFFKFNLG